MRFLARKQALPRAKSRTDMENLPSIAVLVVESGTDSPDNPAKRMPRTCGVAEGFEGVGRHRQPGVSFREATGKQDLG